jgi:DNA-binding GntR family transcriptional regulator
MSAEEQASPPWDAELRAALARLEADGLVTRTGGTWRTSRRWQQAMARAAVTLYEEGDAGDELRVPIALAVLGLYAGRIDEEGLAALVEAILPIERESLGLPPG